MPSKANMVTEFFTCRGAHFLYLQLSISNLDVVILLMPLRTYGGLHASFIVSAGRFMQGPRIS